MASVSVEDYIEFLRAAMEANDEAVGSEPLTLADVRTRSGLNHSVAVQCLEMLAGEPELIRRNPENAAEFLITEPEQLESFIGRVERRGLPNSATPLMDGRRVCEILLHALINEGRLYRLRDLWTDY